MRHSFRLTTISMLLGAVLLAACGGNVSPATGAVGAATIPGTAAKAGAPAAQPTQPPIAAASDAIINSVAAQAAKQGAPFDVATNQAALGTLLGLYAGRGDLQKVFGPPDNLDLSALLNWAATLGVSVDSAKAQLAPYGTAYKALSDATNKGTPIKVKVQAGA